MAVYTIVEREELEGLLAPFGVGPLVDFEGVPEGIENSTWFLTTDAVGSEAFATPPRELVLTIFEQLTEQELEFFVDLTSLLSQRGLPVPAPLRDGDGRAIQQVQGKPALLVPRAIGKHPELPNAEQCREIGNVLGRLHCVTADTGLAHPAVHSLDWLQDVATALAFRVDEADRALLGEVDRFCRLAADNPQLPRAVIHGDLFRDNALFEGSRLVAVIDFFSAGDGYLMFDLAVAANDWCSRHDGSLDPERVEGMLAGYQSARMVSAIEAALWNDFLRIAAARFWLSRLTAWLDPSRQHRSGALTERKDPAEYRAILMHRVQFPHGWPT